MIETVIIAVIVLTIAVWAIASYNSLITLRTKTENSWSDITIQLKRRSDLLPSLMNTVKGYATHESEAFINVAKARAGIDNSKTVADTVKNDNMLQEALKSLFAVAEDYPELKANQNFLDLQDQLADTENKIMASRRYYNGTVKEHNTRQQLFPTNIAAKLFKFTQKEFYNTEDNTINTAPEIKF